MKEPRGIIDNVILQNMKACAGAIADFLKEFYKIFISSDAIERRRKNLK